MHSSGWRVPKIPPPFVFFLSLLTADIIDLPTLCTLKTFSLTLMQGSCVLQICWNVPMTFEDKGYQSATHSTQRLILMDAHLHKIYCWKDFIQIWAALRWNLITLIASHLHQQSGALRRERISADGVSRRSSVVLLEKWFVFTAFPSSECVVC